MHGQDKLRVLIVDDDPDVSAFIKVKLSSEDPDLIIDSVGGARECLDYLRVNETDCILSDFQMPGMDGMGLLLKLNEQGSDVPLIFVTGQGNEEIAREAFKNGAYDYFTKDIGFAHFAIIVNSIKQAVAQRRAELIRKAAAEELERSEEKYRTLIDSANDAIFLADAETGIIVEANKKAEELIGRPAAEIIGMHQSELHPPEEAGRYSRVFEKHIQEGEAVSEELYAQHSDGRRIPVEISANVLNLRGRKLNQGIFRDITERRRAQEAVRESEKRLKEAQEMARMGNWYFDIKTGDVEWSDEVYRIFGLDPAKFTPHIESILALSPWPEDRDRDKAIIKRAMESREQGSYEQRFLLPDGSTGYYFSTFQGKYDEEGNLFAIVGTVLDITEIKRAEEALNARLRQQEAVSLLGVKALESTGLDGLMDLALRKMRDCLCVEFTKVLELLPDGKSLLLRAGTGWKDGFVGHAVVESGRESQAGYTLESGRPVIVEDLRTEKRFTCPALLARHGVVSGISVIIRGKDGPFGVLGAHTARKAIFNEYDVNFVQSIANVLALAVSGRRSEKELAASEERFRSIFESAATGMVTADPEGRFLQVNPAFCRFLGYPQEELLEMKVLDVTHPDDRDLSAGMFDEMRSRRSESMEVEKRYVRKDGAIVWGRVAATWYYGPDSRPLYSVAQIQDITEKKKAQVAIARSLRLVKSLSMPESRFDAEADAGHLFDELLNNFITLTGSEYGFICELENDADGSPFLKTHAISKIDCGYELERGGEPHGGRALEFTNLDNLFGRVITAKESVIANEPSSDPRSGGLPEGHPALNSFLGIPFYSVYSGELVGMVGLANRPGGYDEDLVGYLEPLIDACSNIIEAFRSEQTRMKAEADMETLVHIREAVLDAAGDGIYGLDMEGRTTFVNRAGAAMLGWEPGELLGKVQHDISHHSRPDGSPYQREDCPIYDAYRTGRTREVDGEVFWRKDGSSFPVEYVSTPIIEAGKVSGAVVVFRDVSPRVLARQHAADRERLLALGADVGFALTRGDTTEVMLQGCAEAIVRRLDAAFARIWTFNEAGNILELRASAGMYTHIDGPHGRVPVNDRSKIGTIALWKKPHLTNSVLGDPGVSDQEWAKREGMVAFAGHPLIVDGKLVGVMAMFAQKPLTDASLSALGSVADNIALGIERKRAAEALRYSEEKFRSLVEESQVGAYVYQDGRFIYSNRRFAEMLGYRLDELRKLEDMMVLIHPDDRARAAGVIKAMASGRSATAHAQYKCLKKDGSVINVDAVAWTTGYKGSQAIIGTAVDLTERIKAEEERSALFHMMTHDVKGPLTVIGGYSDLLKESVKDKENAEMVAEISKAAKRISALISNILYLAKMESGKAGLNLEKIKVVEIVRQAIKENELPAGEMGLKVSFEAAKKLPPVTADRAQLGRAIGNLVSNAVKYNTRNGEFTVRCGEAEGDDKEVFVEVSDTGLGIPAEDLPHVFEKYYRGGKTSGISGTGLGLAIVKAIAEAHGGRVEVQSEEGRGSTFRLVLPAA